MALNRLWQVTYIAAGELRTFAAPSLHSLLGNIALERGVHDDMIVEITRLPLPPHDPQERLDGAANSSEKDHGTT